ncbi:MAG: hypothetical protein WCS65_12945, partial [Verrucomicrobiae bacterium]
MIPSASISPPYRPAAPGPESAPDATGLSLDPSKKQEQDFGDLIDQHDRGSENSSQAEETPDPSRAAALNPAPLPAQQPVPTEWSWPMIRCNLTAAPAQEAAAAEGTPAISPPQPLDLCAPAGPAGPALALAGPASPQAPVGSGPSAAPTALPASAAGLGTPLDKSAGLAPFASATPRPLRPEIPMADPAVPAGQPVTQAPVGSDPSAMPATLLAATMAAGFPGTSPDKINDPAPSPGASANPNPVRPAISGAEQAGVSGQPTFEAPANSGDPRAARQAAGSAAAELQARGTLSSSEGEGAAPGETKKPLATSGRAASSEALPDAAKKPDDPGKASFASLTAQSAPRESSMKEDGASPEQERSYGEASKPAPAVLKASESPSIIASSPSAVSVTGAAARNPEAGGIARHDITPFIEKVLDAAKTLASSQPGRIDIDVPLRDNETVRVRVELRSGEIHTTIRTDSPELREALEKSWTDFSAKTGERGLKLAEANFSPLRQDGGGGPSGQGARRDPQPEQNSWQNRQGQGGQGGGQG